MKPLTVILSLLIFAHLALAQLDEKPISTSGVVSLEVFPGRPNYESIDGGDEREEAWILTTSKKERFHLVILHDGAEKFAALRRSLGKKIGVAGTVWPSHTGHHHTPFLITVQSIDEKPDQPPVQPHSTRGSSFIFTKP